MDDIKMLEYSGLYMNARELVRLTKINPVMPGYEMLIKAAVIFRVRGLSKNRNKKGEEWYAKRLNDLYSEVARETSVVPGQKPLTANEESRHIVEQRILEAMRSVGIEDSVKSFIEELASSL